jgi:adenine-specific DNA-methyltransferase
MPTLHWIGKDKVINHHMDVPFKVLEHSYGFDNGTQSEQETNSGNKIIHGDNLEALKSLLPEYEGKVKCIYIDPPYNTGNENWVYNDNVNDPKIKKWLGQVVGKESEDLSRHDKWLCMIYPRLKLLSKLLSDDGIILISIDDFEFSNIKSILDEIFGSRGFFANFVWRRRVSSSMAASWISKDHEYVLSYSKNPDTVFVNGEERDMDKYNIPDGTGRYYASMPLTVGMTKEMRPNQWYGLKHPKTGTTYWPPNNRVWGYYPPTMNEKVAQNLIIFPEDFPDKKLTTPRLKSYPEDAKRDRKPLSTWIFEQNQESDTLEVNILKTAKNEEGTRILKSIFSDSVFSYAKPLSLIESLIGQFTKNDDIVLDSFAGSGTTAHAVLSLNKRDKGCRKFILVEMENYIETITIERIKNVIVGYGEGTKKVEGTGGSFDFYELGQPLFLENGNLNELTDVEKIRQYVYYTETKTPLSGTKHKDNKYFLDKHNDTAYYFHYEQDEITTLDHAFLATVHTKAEQYVIYADNCLLTKDFMTKHSIIFKKIPRDITRF